MENKNNTFTTETDERYVHKQAKKVRNITCSVMGVLALLGLLVTWQFCVLLECTIIFTYAIGSLAMRKNNHNFLLEFVNDRLYITNRGTGQSYEVWDIPASDFRITQSKSDMANDYGRVVIKNTIFVFGGVKNCEALKEYIKNNYR